MRLDKYPDCHLTYCTNIHPGESWQEVFAQFQQHLAAVKKNISPDKKFGLGIRLSAQAASELLQGDNLPQFKAWLDDAGMYVFTVNGFPYGLFHKQRVKEKVYLPDWSTPTRLEYTQHLSQILAELLPQDCIGSISTVPIGLKSDFSEQEKVLSARDNLLSMAIYLAILYQDTGRKIKLALEPEPGCYLEKTDDIVAFFHDHLFSDEASARLKSLAPESLVLGPHPLLEYLGICLDTCHTSVMYETPKKVSETLSKHGIGIFKIQLTAALSANEVDHASLGVLQQLADPVYLHQTTISTVQKLNRFFLDLPEALEQAVIGDSIRVHYHVPVFLKNIGKFATTRAELVEFLLYFRDTPFCQHLEVETYTFDVLPEAYRQNSVVENVSQELQWVLETLEK